MADEKYNKAVAMLCEKHEQLGCLPKRSDFSPDEVCFIKQKLGPWTRALEAAGNAVAGIRLPGRGAHARACAQVV